MPRSISSAYFDKLQEDGQFQADLIDLETQGPTFHWTTANQPLLYTLSGDLTEYAPFPGTGLENMKEDMSLGVNMIAFAMANTGQLLSDLLTANDMSMATIKIGRVFTDTPDLGRMDIYKGRIGNLSYDRDTVAAQGRSQFAQANNRFPYYNYQDKCVWRFGSSGCGVDTTSFTLAMATTSWDISSSTTLNLLAASGTLTLSYSNGRFDFGRMTVTDGVNSGQVRTIRLHSGELIELSHPLPIDNLTAFAADIYPGCRKRRVQDCHSLYDNAAGFVGFEWIPIQEDAF